jgi:tRNA-binding protein
MATFADFEKLDIRTGVIREVEPFPRTRKPSYRLTIDFDPEIGTKRSSAQVTNYRPEELVGMQVIAVVNFAPKNIAGFRSEVLVLGVPDEDDQISLLTPSRPAQLGGRLY